MNETAEHRDGGLRQWLNKQWDSLFADETYRLLKYRFKRRPKEVEKHISMLRSIMKFEPDYFWRDVCRPNLLAYLYLIHPATNWTETGELIQRSLEMEMTGVAAQLNHFRVLTVQGKDDEAAAVLEKLNDLDSRADSNVLRLVATAEVAYCLEYFGPDFYPESIRKYEKVLEEIDKLSELEREHELIRNKLCSWKFQLAQTYTRLMTRGKTEQPLGDCDISSAFRRCSKLLLEVIESRDPFYHGKALVELVELYKKNEFYGMIDNVEFPYKVGPRECIDEAYEISRDDDPYVLERCGRYYRQKSSKEEEYLFAIKVLNEAIDLSPSRHMAWHQMYLAYKRLSDCNRKAQNYCHHNDFSNGESAAKRLGKASTTGYKEKTTSRSHASYKGRNTTNSQQKENFSEKAMEYCNKSIECLLKATKLMENTSCRYLVDLANSYAFCKRVSEAESCYRLAANTEECVDNDNDGAYLYENWANLRDTQNWVDLRDTKKVTAGSLDEIKHMYREAIKLSLRGNLTCGRLAFFNLRRILNRELKTSDDVAIQLEASVLLSEVKFFEKEENVLIALLDALKNDPVKVDNTWKLIELYHTRNRLYDASAACAYLTALDRAGQLALEEERVEDNITIRRKIIIELATRAAEESSTGTIAKLRATARRIKSDETTNVGSGQLEHAFPQQDLRHAFRWLAGGKSLWERGFLSNNDNGIDIKYNSTDLCLLTLNEVRQHCSDGESRTTNIDRLRRLLEDWCALGDGISGFPDDLCFDHSFSQAAAAMVSKTKAVAVVLGRGLDESDLGGTLAGVLDRLNQLNLRRNVCFVVEEGFPLDVRFSQFDWPRFEASSSLTDAGMISSFFQVLFLDSTQE